MKLSCFSCYFGEERRGVGWTCRCVLRSVEMIESVVAMFMPETEHVDGLNAVISTGFCV
jgi:hypothetical protein